MATILERFEALLRSPALATIRIEPGRFADYLTLQHLHYRAGPPATIDRVLRAIDPAEPWGQPLVGVLVISRPALNGPWRRRAWPGWLDGLSPTLAAARINSDLRTISRVIVRPAWRGRGIARALIEHALASATTPRTEAIASMGAMSPLFLRAGMRPVASPPSASRLRLLAALHEARLRPWHLADPLARRDVLRDHTLMRRLRRWANDSRSTRRLRHGPAEELVKAAAIAAAPRPRIFIHG